MVNCFVSQACKFKIPKFKIPKLKFSESCHFDVRRNLRKKFYKDWLIEAELLVEISPYVEMTKLEGCG